MERYFVKRLTEIEDKRKEIYSDKDPYAIVIKWLGTIILTSLFSVLLYRILLFFGLNPSRSMMITFCAYWIFFLLSAFTIGMIIYSRRKMLKKHP